jgi:polyisoprenoid-binding protein YceI
MTTTIAQTGIPTGTWTADPVHSTVVFEVAYASNVFAGEVSDLDAKLEDGRLSGAARIASLRVKDENLEGHLLSPEFFAAAQHPEVRFESAEIQRDGDAVDVVGEVTIKGITRPATLRGTIAGPLVDHFGKERVVFKLETVVDRTQFDMNWNMPLPTGEPALANEVTLKANLTLVGA